MRIVINLHYPPDYSKYPDLKSKDKAALADLIAEIGQTRYGDIVKEFGAVPRSRMPFKRFLMYMAAASLHGYPVISLYKNIYGLDKTEDELYSER